MEEKNSKAIVPVEESEETEVEVVVEPEVGEKLRAFALQAELETAMMQMSLKQFKVFSNSLGVTIKDLPESFMPAQETTLQVPGTDITITLSKLIGIWEVLRSGTTKQKTAAIIAMSQELEPFMKFMEPLMAPWGETLDEGRRRKREQLSVAHRKPQRPPRSFQAYYRVKSGVVRGAKGRRY